MEGTHVAWNSVDWTLTQVEETIWRHAEGRPFGCRPYSLRRGGATHYFQLHGRFDSLLVLGRWQAASTARIYLNEGLAVLAELSLPWNPFQEISEANTSPVSLNLCPSLSIRRNLRRPGGDGINKRSSISTGNVLSKKGGVLSCLGLGQTLRWPVIPWPRVTLGLAEFPLGVFSGWGSTQKILLRGGDRFCFLLMFVHIYWQNRSCRAGQKRRVSMSLWKYGPVFKEEGEPKPFFTASFGFKSHPPLPQKGAV